MGYSRKVVSVLQSMDDQKPISTTSELTKSVHTGGKILYTSLNQIGKGLEGRSPLCQKRNLNFIFKHKSIVLLILMLFQFGGLYGQTATWSKYDANPVVLTKFSSKIMLMDFYKGEILSIGDTGLTITCDLAGLSMFVEYPNSDEANISLCDQTITVKLNPVTQSFKVKIESQVVTFYFDPTGRSEWSQSIGAYAINIFNDARALSRGERADTIRMAYAIDPNSIIWNEIDSIIHPFGIQAQGGPDNVFKLSSGIGNMEITSVADGFAKFLVSRVKKELSIAFFNRFKSTLNSADMADFRVLFPETRSQLSLIDEKVYEIKPYLNGLRMASVADFRTIPAHLPELLKKETLIKKSLDKNIYAKYGTSILFGLIKEIDQSDNFGIALENLNQYKLSPDTTTVDLDKYVEIIRLFSFALKNKEKSEKYYISPDEIGELIKDGQLLKYFVGLTLAYAKLGSIQPVVISNIISGEVDGLYQSHRAELLSVLNSYQEATHLFAQAKNTNENEANITYYFQAANKILESTEVITKVSFPDNQRISIFVDNMHLGVNLVSTLYTKDYVSTVAYIGKIYKAVKEEIKDSLDANLDNVITKVLKYGTFLAQISQTDNSDEIATIIEQYAAPVGSYRSKCMNKFTVAVDSYVGAGYRIGNSYGGVMINTPVGVSLSFSKGNGKYSFTLMPTLFDIGPLVSYRFSNSGDESPPKIYLKEIISPGIFASFGYNSKIPIFFNLGYQKPALLTKIGTTENAYGLEPINYFSASLGVNIPLVTVYNR